MFRQHRSGSGVHTGSAEFACDVEMHQLRTAGALHRWGELRTCGTRTWRVERAVRLLLKLEYPRSHQRLGRHAVEALVAFGSL
jgi:hypothetical protein